MQLTPIILILLIAGAIFDIAALILVIRLERRMNDLLMSVDKTDG